MPTTLTSLLPFSVPMTVFGSDLHLLSNLPLLLPQPLSIMLWRGEIFLKVQLFFAPCGLLLPTELTKPSETHSQWWLHLHMGMLQLLLQPHKEPQGETAGVFHSTTAIPWPAITTITLQRQSQPLCHADSSDTRTSSLTSGLRSTGGKKTILPPLLLLLRLLFLSACSSTHRQQPRELCTTGTSLQSQS